MQHERTAQRSFTRAAWDSVATPGLGPPEVLSNVEPPPVAQRLLLAVTAEWWFSCYFWSARHGTCTVQICVEIGPTVLDRIRPNEAKVGVICGGDAALRNRHVTNYLRTREKWYAREDSNL